MDEKREPDLDEIDWAIIDRLRDNARESAADIAKASEVQLTESAVRRRITRLRDTGVITGFHVALNHDKTTPFAVEAYIELSFEVGANIQSTIDVAMNLREVRDAMMLAGETDALLRVRADDLKSLREIVMALRKSAPVTRTVTRIVLERWWYGSPRRTIRD
jgi:DNA-binding Lrp family transcriptional regulator